MFYSFPQWNFLFSGLKVGSIDAMVPVEKSDFEQLEKAVVNKITMYTESPHFPDFIESLIKNLCLDQSAATLKKIKMNVEALHTAKLKDERAKAKKPNAKKGGTIRMDTTKVSFHLRSLSSTSEIENMHNL